MKAKYVVSISVALIACIFGGILLFDIVEKNLPVSWVMACMERLPDNEKITYLENWKGNDENKALIAKCLIYRKLLDKDFDFIQKLNHDYRYALYPTKEQLKFFHEISQTPHSEIKITHENISMLGKYVDLRGEKPNAFNEALIACEYPIPDSFIAGVNPTDTVLQLRRYKWMAKEFPHAQNQLSSAYWHLMFYNDKDSPYILKRLDDVHSSPSIDAHIKRLCLSSYFIFALHTNDEERIQRLIQNEIYLPAYPLHYTPEVIQLIENAKTKYKLEGTEEKNILTLRVTK